MNALLDGPDSSSKPIEKEVAAQNIRENLREMARTPNKEADETVSRAVTGGEEPQDAAMEVDTREDTTMEVIAYQKVVTPIVNLEV